MNKNETKKKKQYLPICKINMDSAVGNSKLTLANYFLLKIILYAHAR